MMKWKCPECGWIIESKTNDICGDCSDLPNVVNAKTVSFLPMDKRKARRIKRNRIIK